LLVAALLLTVLVAIRDRQGIEAGGVGSLMAGRVAGTLPGAFLIAALPVGQTRFVLGLMILAAVAMSVAGLRIGDRPAMLFGVGVVSGFMSATAAVGGPPIALAYQHAEGQRLRGTLSFVLTFGTIISLAGLYLAGRFRWVELEMAAALIPGTLVGFLLSRRTAALVDRGYTRPAVLIMAASTAAVIVITSLLGMGA
jgi:uncharacterized membrane protein YfcA